MPPRAQHRPHATQWHGIKLEDPYAWLRAENWQKVMRDPSQLAGDIRSYLEAENAFTSATLAETGPLQDALFAEMKGRTAQSVKPEQAKVSAYYNLDNGTGKIRGVYMQGNGQVEPIFRVWLDAFKDLGATTLSMSNTGGTDHLSFDAAGIPGFQFIQDPMDYSTRTHHSNMDNWDHLVGDDLKQAATIIASFIWHTSQRDEMIPRKTLDLGDNASGGN